MTLWVALVVLVVFSAFFSASETAFSSLNQIRLKSRAEDGDSSAARVLAMAEQYDKLLSTILIGNNIVNIAAASIGTIIFTKMLGAERGATVSTMVLTVVVLIFGEVTPKSLAKEMPEKVATAVSPFLVLLMALMTPLTWLFTQWNGEMMNPCTPTRQFSKFLERNGFRHRKFHALRHTSATLLLYGGVSLKQVQGRLGHGDIETTNKYLHCLQEADEEAAGVLQSMLTVSRKPKPEQAQTQTEPTQAKAGA